MISFSRWKLLKRSCFVCSEHPKNIGAMPFFETSHVIPRNDAIRETLAWFDRYLGPVKRKEQ